MGVLGVPLYHGVAFKIIYRHLISHLTMEYGRFTGSLCAHHRDSPYKAAPIRFFKFVWGLLAGTEDPKMK
jgi:hypothetical protein